MKFWLVGPRRMQIAKLFLGEFEYIFALPAKAHIHLLGRVRGNTIPFPYLLLHIH